MADTALVPHSTPEKPDNPGAKSAAHLAQIPAVTICRDVYGGTLTLREKGKAYLPQFPKEDDKTYAARLAGAVLYNAFRRTVKGLTGMVFAEEPTLGEDVPVEIRGQEADADKGQAAVTGYAENVDLAGRHLAVFMRDNFDAKLVDGHVHTFVDWSGPDGAVRKTDEASARPYCVQILKGQVLRHRTENKDGETVLVSFAYAEEDTVSVGEFSERPVWRVRQYDLVSGEGANAEVSADGDRVRYRSWTRDKEGKEWVPEKDEALGERMTRIPLVTDYADRSGFMRSDPPLLDLALENLDHYQTRSDRRQTLKIAGQPILTIIGATKEKVGTVTVGSGIGLVLEDAASSVAYTEAKGTSLEQSRQELQDIEQRMASMGLSMLQRDTRAAETAESKRIDKGESDSRLATNARATQDATEEVLGFFAMWMGKPDGGSVAVNQDFFRERIDPQMAQVLLAAAQAGDLHPRTVWAALVEGGALPKEFDPDVEEMRLGMGDNEMERAAEDRRARAQQDEGSEGMMAA